MCFNMVPMPSRRVFERLSAVVYTRMGCVTSAINNESAVGRRARCESRVLSMLVYIKGCLLGKRFVAYLANEAPTKLKSATRSDDVCESNLLDLQMGRLNVPFDQLLFGGIQTRDGCVIILRRPQALVCEAAVGPLDLPRIDLPVLGGGWRCPGFGRNARRHRLR